MLFEIVYRKQYSNHLYSSMCTCKTFEAAVEYGKELYGEYFVEVK